ncbi:peroxidasin homolog [Stylophora pistillata]|uniref:peroxidasin homolog n=1 Tax=Stylophora pistillata TaxID=50429 RepID=UPI000C03D698|nr:peroxidasin homolog [Stylophora pistillata]
MTNLAKSYGLCLMDVLLLNFLSSLMIQDVSSAPSAKCEIKSSCSLSSGCQFTNQMTVDPGSKIPTNCSVNTGGKAKVVTWNQAKQRVGTSSGGVSDLVLEKVSSPASGSYSCECTSVNFTRDLQVILGSSTPNIITKDKTFDLECHFVGWPLPTTVNWYKEKSLANNVTHTLITNGTMRMYHSQEKAWKNGKEILRSSLHLPSGTEDQEGFYTCKAQSTIIGWSSSASYTIQMIYECPLPQTPTVSSSQISASKFSNVSLTCLVDTDESGCPEELYWFKNNDKTSLASGGRYNIALKNTHTKCQQEFILTIFNITKNNDEGMYSCHWICEYEETKKAFIDLKVSS